MALAQNCEVRATQQGRELAQHGTAWFPLAAYQEDLTCFYVPWHWHDDFVYILAARGTVTVGVGKSRLYLHQGQGVLINCGGLHEVETVPGTLACCGRWCSVPGWWGAWIRCFGKSWSPRCRLLVRRLMCCWMRLCPGRRRRWSTFGMRGGR